MRETFPDPPDTPLWRVLLVALVDTLVISAVVISAVATVARLAVDHLP